ncbi:MAG TPA: nucleotidyl transferase AbiEii/AbiGii toxin family protein [Baekduia sp.]|uniref:nucleotidyl transferase AbiEii/AbiGii toxin family protein n=1 Tax=Baekduia sp. TaxID=2600305 RepID=UPI002B83EC38|nr:nucleotidyl transferase AbiEii/AbiGii toxin family protein [Baekduia sp.]HMJ33156.1 nucleotidyl transferase AbiEii/AbiGii toxin family protein [Baekduia sp.]
MIPRAAIDQRVREWGLRHGVVEKDYVLGWLLWGIGGHPVLGRSWIFKGGTCLKKCYIETYRFSEDLDFTIIDGGPIDPADVAPLLAEVLASVSDGSGIDFSDRQPTLKARRQPGSVEGRVYYRGPLAAPAVASVKLDLSATELLAREPERRPIAHPYAPDESLPEPADVACYAFEEVFAEKLRAMGERSRPRDLYDIVNLYRRDDLRIRRDDIHAILVEKCAHKGIGVPTLASIDASGLVPELESEWENMLGHQLPALPPFEQFWDALGDLFRWLDGAEIAPALAPLGTAANEDVLWTPPPTVGVWGTDIPLEEIRFAAVNHLCVELGYQGSTRLIEPYSLRRTRDGNLVLHALRHESGEHRSYRVDRIQSAHATSVPFTPTYAVEFSSAGPLAAPPSTRRSTTATRAPRHRRTTRTGPVYVIECPLCGKRFDRTTHSRKLNAHKNPYGTRCPGQGRTGYLVDTRW